MPPGLHRRLLHIQLNTLSSSPSSFLNNPHFTIATMAPNRVALSKNAAPNKSLYATIKDEATNPENTTIVRSLLVFGVCGS